MQDMHENNGTQASCPRNRNRHLETLFRFDEAETKAFKTGGEIEDSAIVLNGCSFLCKDLIEGLTIVFVGMGENPTVTRTIYPNQVMAFEQWQGIKARDRRVRTSCSGNCAVHKQRLDVV